MTIPADVSLPPSPAGNGSHDLPSSVSGSQQAPATPQPFSPDAELGPAPVAKRKRPVGAIITIVLLILGLATAVSFLVVYLLELQDAQARIEEQDLQINEQQKLIDKKETFGAAMEGLLETAGQFEGTLYSTIIPTSSYQLTASRAWTHRWDLEDLDGDIAKVNEATEKLDALLASASAEASSNATGSQYEATIDQLSGGYVASLIYDADTFCQSDVLACVDSSDPYTVHFDAADNNVEYTNDFVRAGIAYHEFAHVLQFTNPAPTEVALASFGGDEETMADCFALTFLDGWKLDHRIYVSSYMYWDVSIGYGYTCNDSQKQVVRDWYSQLGYTSAPISQ